MVSIWVEFPIGDSKGEGMKLLKHLPYLLAGIAFLGLSSHVVASPVGIASINTCPGGGVEFNATETFS
jgi:hypothetical protein